MSELVEYYPLRLAPLAVPNFDPGEHIVFDAENAHIFMIAGSRERAEAIVATLNAAGSVAPAAGPRMREALLVARDAIWSGCNTVYAISLIDEALESSAAVAQDAVNVLVAGSNPASPAKSAPGNEASHLHGERDPSVMLDLTGADTHSPVVASAQDARPDISKTDEEMLSQGWRMVPCYPVSRQMDAGLYQSSADSQWADVFQTYVDMVRAAPEPPEHSEGDRATDPVEAERARCAGICQEWIDNFAGTDIQFTPANEYAVDAIQDIIDLIRNGHALSSTDRGSVD